MSSPPAATPRVHAAPPYDKTRGAAAIELADFAGLCLDPWQQDFLLDAMGRRHGRWSAFEVALVCPRQNGKGAVLEARELAEVLLVGPGERPRLVIHSAHNFETSVEHMRRLLGLLEQTPRLRSKVQRVLRASGQEGIEFTNGSRIKFKTRTKGGGRGLSGDLVVLDEAMELSEASLAALMPTLSARPDPQLWYAGSAVDQLVHSNGLVLARVRARGHKGDDPSLCYGEFSVDPDVYNRDPRAVAADPEQWAIANPGYEVRIPHENIANEHRSMGMRDFATERLGIGDWPDLSEGADQKIPAGVWSMLEDPESKIDGEVAFAFDVTPERDYAAIGAAGRRADGKKHLEVLVHDVGTRWVVPELLRLIERHNPCAVLVDGRSPAASLVPELEEAGVRVASGDPQGRELIKVVSLQEMSQACGALYDAAMSDGLRHLGQAWLDGALASAKERDVGDGAWAWARKSGGNIAPLVAVTLASHGHAVYSQRARPDPALNVW